MEGIRYFSMFSGVEGFGLGIEKARKAKAIGFSEIDKYASQVLKYHYPNVKNYGDCTAIKWNDVPDFDILTGGSPCQDFSIAGKRRGLGGSRSSLAWEFIRALRDKKPRYFIWENVKGVLSSRSGWDFANLISAFSESGYSLWWQVLNAKDFGVPQNRERIFVVGFREGSSKEVFFEREDSKTAYEQGWNKLREQVANTIRTNYSNGRNNETYIEIQNKIKTIGKRHFQKTIYSPQGISPTVREGHGDVIRIQTQNKGASQHYRIYGEDGLAPTLQSQSGMSSQKHPFVVVPTIRAEHHNTADVHYISQGTRVRRLMPIECERLMSWPDDWTKWGVNEKGEKVEISDSQRYKMCGNGVVSKVVEEIVKVLF